MPKRRHALSALSNTTRHLFRRSTSALSRRQLLAKILRERLNRLRQSRLRRLQNNRRKKITHELQEFIKFLKTEKIDKAVIQDFRELSHYAYIFDIEHYKTQLESKEREALRSLGDVILHYCTSGSQRGIDPSHLFDTTNYLTKNPEVAEKRINPMVHFFNHGIHANRLSMDDIHFMRKMANIKRPDPSAIKRIEEDPNPEKIGVFLHIFYPELAKTIANHLRNIPRDIDVYVSTTKEAVQDLHKIFSQVENCRKADVRCFQNTGRDVAPFIVGFGDQILQYEIILKLHSKKARTAQHSMAGFFTAWTI